MIRYAPDSPSSASGTPQPPPPGVSTISRSPRRDRAAGDRAQLDDLAAGSHDALRSAGSRRSALHAVRRDRAVLGQDRQLGRLEERELAHDPVAAVASVPRPPEPRRIGEALDAHGIAALEHLDVGDARVRHVAVHGARAGEPGPRAAPAAQRLVVAVALVRRR